jgi:hypothetical protein
MTIHTPESRGRTARRLERDAHMLTAPQESVAAGIPTRPVASQSVDQSSTPVSYQRKGVPC